MRMLLIEDDHVLGQAVRDQSVADGHSVDWVKGIGDAHAAILSAPFELVLLDLMLPDGRGLDFLKARRAAGDATPVIVLTARDQISDRIAALDIGGTDKLTGSHAAFSNGGVGSNIQAKRYRCVGSGGCQATRSLRSPLRTAARTCNMRCAPRSDHCICCFLTIRRATRESTVDSASEEAIRRPDR